MAEKPGFFDYITAAFNARPFGMFVAPNWIGLGAFGLLGMMEPGFWVLGAGLELGYLLALATNERFQRLVAAVPLVEATADWNKRIQALLGRLDAGDRRIYDLLSQRCRSIIDLQLHGATARDRPRRPRSAGRQPRPPVVDVPAAARRAPHHPAGHRRIGRRRRPPPARDRRLERQQGDASLTDELRRSLGGQLDILKQRLLQRTDAERKLAYIDAELERIQQQVELIREQAALSTDPELLSQRIDEITATLGTTGQWIRDQQKVYGAMEDLLTEPPPLAPMRGRGRVSE